MAHSMRHDARREREEDFVIDGLRLQRSRKRAGECRQEALDDAAVNGIAARRHHGDDPGCKRPGELVAHCKRTLHGPRNNVGENRINRRARQRAAEHEALLSASNEQRKSHTWRRRHRAEYGRDAAAQTGFVR